MMKRRSSEPIHEIRRKNLASLIDEVGKGVDLAKLYDCSDAYISNVLNGYDNIGRVAARKFEAITGKPKGWLDKESEGLLDESGETFAPAGYVIFDLLDIRAAAGPGFVAPEEGQYEIVRQVTVLEEWARFNLGRDFHNFKIISASGISMQGTIENGDILFVDTRIDAFDGDGIYVIARSGLLQVKRLQILQGNILAIISDNKTFESERLNEEEVSSIKVCGRVVASWSMKKFW